MAEVPGQRERSGVPTGGDALEIETKAVYKNLGTAYTDSYSKTPCNLLASFIILRMPPLQPLHKAYLWTLPHSANGIEASVRNHKNVFVSINF